MSPATSRSVASRHIGGTTVLLVAAMAAGTVPQFALPVLAPALVADIGLTRTHLGTIMAGYYLCTALISIRVGALTDRVAHSFTIAGCFFCGGLSLVAVGAATGLVSLGVSATLGAFAAALTNPATNRVVICKIPARARGMVVGAKQSGVQVASIGSGLILPGLAALVGWRLAIVMVGAALMLTAAALVPIDLGRPIGQGQPSAGKTRALTGGTDLGSLCAYAGCMGAGMACLATYLPTFVVEQAGWSLQRAGALVAVIGVAGVSARLLWGWVAGRLGDPLVPLPWLALAAACVTVLLFLDPMEGPVMWLVAAVLGFTSFGWQGVAMLGALKIAGPHRIGRGTGKVVVAFYAGLGLSPIPFGWLVDVTGTYRLAWLLVSSAFALGALTQAAPIRSRSGGIPYVR